MSHINNLRYAVDTSLMAESEEELKSFLMKVKEESEKPGLKITFKIQRSWHPVPSLHGKYIGKKQKQWEILFSWATKLLWRETAALKLKGSLLLGGKAMRKLDSLLKSRDITLPTKVCLVKAMVFQ